MPFLLAEILNFQGSTHLIGVGSLSYLFKELNVRKELSIEEINDFILEEYQKSNYFVPTISIRIKKY